MAENNDKAPNGSENITGVGGIESPTCPKCRLVWAGVALIFWLTVGACLLCVLVQVILEFGYGIHGRSEDRSVLLFRHVRHVAGTALGVETVFLFILALLVPRGAKT
jgi:hypothetical protein